MTKEIKSSVVFQIWRSFLLFILIPVVLLDLAIFCMFFNIENSTKELVRQRMDQAQYLLNQDLIDSLSSLEKVGNSFEIQRMSEMKFPLAQSEYVDLLQVKEQAQTMVLANDAYSVHIICNGSDLALIDGELCLELSYFYPRTYSFGTTPLEELKTEGYRYAKIQFYPFSYFQKGEERQEGIYYTTPLTSYAGKASGATAVVFFAEKNFETILQNLDFEGGLTYLMDAGGQILYVKGESQIQPKEFALRSYEGQGSELPVELFGKDNYAIARSVTGGLQIVSVIPRKSMLSQVRELGISIIILNVTTICMCLFLSLSVAKKRSLILSNTLKMMGAETPEETNVYSALYQSARHMMEANQTMKQKLSSQKELLQRVFWDRMITKVGMSEEEVHHLAVSAGVPENAGSYCLIVACFANGYEMGAEDWNNLLLKREELLEELSHDPKREAYIGAGGMDQILMLIPIPEDQRGDYQNYVLQQASRLEEIPTLICAASPIFKNLSDLKSACVMCENQINASVGYVEKTEIIWCSEEELGTEATFYYGDELKNQIVLWIRSGQQEQVKAGFRRILEENYLNRQISPEMEHLLIAKLKLTLLGAYDSRMSLDITEVFEHIDKIQTDAWRFSYILRVAMDMCGHYLTGIRSHEQGLQKKVTGYIEEHYMEYGFSLSSISAYCGLSEAYFSQIFKELVGENFSSYVERKRMERASCLIRETDLTIDSIAEKVGYSNTNAFRKAYKRYFGVTPSQIRKNSQISE